jgi:hypothetical protein
LGITDEDGQSVYKKIDGVHQSRESQIDEVVPTFNGVNNAILDISFPP